MNLEIITLFVNAALEIYRRHESHGEILTDEQVNAMLKAELDSGQHAIALWFAAKGLPLPE